MRNTNQTPRSTLSTALRAIGLTAAVAAVAAIPACAPDLHDQPRDPALYRDQPPSPGSLRTGEQYIEGTLTAEGVECQALRTDGGDLYTLLNVPPELENTRERVWVVGAAQEISYCMQGRTLLVVRMGLR